jgi:hypothetical protein
MNQRHNLIAGLGLLMVFVFSAVADAGLLWGCKDRRARTCVCDGTTASGQVCSGRGPTEAKAKENAQACCSEPIVSWICRWEFRRKGLFGRCRITVCEIPACDSCAGGAKMRGPGPQVMAACPVGGGQYCYGSGSNCAAAISDAKAHCTHPITGDCQCPVTPPRRSRCR